MWMTLMATTFLMGLVGGVHCLAMCAVPCGVITSSNSSGPKKIHFKQVLDEDKTQSNFSKVLAFHFGRLLGYAALGALAAYAIGQLAWFSDRTSLLHPLWVGVHLIAFFWGAFLLLLARQPQFLEKIGRAGWRCLQRVLTARGGLLTAGMLWAFMPCGLLYSAVMVAALADGALHGALVMLCFAVSSAVWLIFGVLGFKAFRLFGQHHEQLAIRISGVLLLIISSWALWIDLIHKPAQWCR